MMARFVIGFEASTKLWVQYDRKTFANLSPNETLVYLLNGEMKAGFATQIISTDFMRKYSPESIFIILKIMFPGVDFLQKVIKNQRC